VQQGWLIRKQCQRRAIGKLRFELIVVALSQPHPNRVIGHRHSLVLQAGIVSFAIDGSVDRDALPGATFFL
jgi:hypothetical protein